MSSVTGVELGPDYCVLVKARRRDTAIEVTALRLFDPADWSDDPALQALRLNDARRELRLPRRATVVAWDQAPSTSHDSVETTLTAAGFTVETVLSPVDALALVAWSRSSRYTDAAVAWLSIDHHGAAIAVVRNTDILYSREFSWRIQASEQRVQAHLLRRYLYVAQLTPELRRAIQIVQQQFGTTIQSAVACGNVPDLRTLTMPLIRELDIEIETLDSMDGFQASGPVLTEVAQNAPSIQLAGAAAGYGETSTKGRSARWLAGAAGLMLATGAAWWAFTVWAAPSRSSDARPASEPPAVSARAAQPSGTAGNDAAPRKSSDAERETAPTRAPVPPPRPQPSMGVTGSDRPEGGSQSLDDPLPSVGGVLISADRRLAVVDGAVVGVGDRVGTRIVAQIDLDAVVLREPSGRQVRVPIRTKNGTL